MTAKHLPYALMFSQLNTILADTWYALFQCSQTLYALFLDRKLHIAQSKTFTRLQPENRHQLRQLLNQTLLLL